MSKASYFFLIMIRMMNSILRISFREYDYKARPKQIITTLSINPISRPTDFKIMFQTMVRTPTICPYKKTNTEILI